MSRKKKKKVRKSPFYTPSTGIDLERFRTDIGVLSGFLEQLQQAYCGKSIHDTKENVVYWPEPWLIAMEAHPMLRHELHNLLPLTLEELAPMPPKMRDLCKDIGLPVYHGRAKLPVRDEPAQRASKPQHSKRCSRCGDKLKPLGHRHIKEAISQNLEVFTSNEKVQEFVDAETEAQKKAPLICQHCGV